MKLLATLLSALCIGLSPAIAATSPKADQAYGEALELIHAYGGGNELQRAMAIADALSRSDPQSGYAQVLLAEALSTWRLAEDGTPQEVRDQVIALAQEALRLNPRLAQAHVSKARALMRASRFEASQAAVRAALAIDPRLPSALFVLADTARRTGDIAAADRGYREFIAATGVNTRKANGYGWMGQMYQDATYLDPANRASHVAKGREAFEQSVMLDPSAWKLVSFAVFLNDHAADFEGAERHALRALQVMEFPMARHHLAAARYQKLGARAPTMSPDEVQREIAAVFESSRVSLAQAIGFSAFSGVVKQRLRDLQRRATPAAQ